MKTREFYDSVQADQYLSSSIILYDNLPVYVNHVDANQIVNMSYLSSLGMPFLCRLDDDKLDMNPVPLGFISHVQEGGYPNPWETMTIQRIPARKWKIGLSLANCVLKSAFSINGTPLNARLRDILPSRYLVNTILNVYHDIDLANKRSQNLKKETLAVPFSRSFAIYKNNIFFKHFCIPIGEYNAGKFSLKDECLFLIQALEEDLK